MKITKNNSNILFIFSIISTKNLEIFPLHNILYS
jgi:hypothetical protein